MAGATAYVQECEVASASLEAVFGRNEVDDSNASSDLMWGEFAQTFDAFASAYRRIDPPPELESYHGANLSAAEALRDLALTRPSGESFTQEFLTLAAQPIVMALVEIGNDLTKTDEEKERLAEETVREKYAEFFGPGFADASQTLEAARESLSDEALSILDASNCYAASLSNRP